MSQELVECFGLEVMVPHVEMNAGRIAATDFETIERRERLQGDEVGRYCRRRRITAR